MHIVRCFNQMRLFTISSFMSLLSFSLPEMLYLPNLLCVPKALPFSNTVFFMKLFLILFPNQNTVIFPLWILYALMYLLKVLSQCYSVFHLRGQLNWHVFNDKKNPNLRDVKMCSLELITSHIVVLYECVWVTSSPWMVISLRAGKDYDLRILYVLVTSTSDIQ